MKRVDISQLAGRCFGQLTVVREGPPKVTPRGRVLPTVECRCTCGNVVVVQKQTLTGGYTRSCGCRGGGAFNNPLHGHTAGQITPTWVSWSSMLTRCLNTRSRAYSLYGGRGVTVCDRWAAPNGEGFKAFLEDMGERPPGTTLDRKDVDGNYEPGNCRWATPREQGNNRRNNRRITAFGRTRTLSEWATEAGIGRATIARRLAAGWPAERALTQSTDRQLEK